MSLFHTANLVNSNLVAYYDIGNPRCFQGTPTTNLIPNGNLNAYPTIGNQWGTYNVNQFNNGSYFSIGTISSVSNNIVTTSSNHPLRTYDVISPQMPGGGVNPGLAYFVKKISNTQFSLHTYNNSQDGSQGFINPNTNNHKVYDSIMNDVKVNITQSAFPTSWIGPANLPNSGLVKEIIRGGFFVNPLPRSDCIRLHYIRDDGVKDGMSFGVEPTITNTNNPHVFSFYARAVNEKSKGKNIQFLVFNYNAVNSTQQFFITTLRDVGEWTKYIFSYTPIYTNMYIYWFSPTTNDIYSWDLASIQLENRNISTHFTPTSRGGTVATGGGLKNLINNNLNGEFIFTSLNPGAQYSNINGGCLFFDGLDDYIQLGSLGNPSRFSISFWINPSTLDTSPANNYRRLIVSDVSSNFIILEENGAISFRVPGVNETYWATSGGLITINNWYNITCTYNQNHRRVYINGIFRGENQIGAGTVNLGPLKITDTSIQAYHGFFSQFAFYNDALTEDQIYQNFQLNKRRYGL